MAIGPQIADGESGLNYLCAGYRAFFMHIDPLMRQMASLLYRGRTPADKIDTLTIAIDTLTIAVNALTVVMTPP